MKTWMCTLLCFLSLAVAGQHEALFDSATADYNKGDFEAAAKKYQQILDQGMHSAALYYNLGNSYYKLNQIAPSIYYYEKALLLDPNDREIANNLAFARNMTLDDIEPLPQTGIAKLLEGITGGLTSDQWARVAIFLMFLFVALYLAYYFLRYTTQKRLAFILSLVALCLSLASFSLAYLKYRAYQEEQPAIVFAREVSVQSEPNARSQSAFVLHEGTKVEVLETLNTWKKIQIADGSTGWIPADDIRLLKDF